MGRWTLWRRDRAARSKGTANGIRCPDCGTVTRGLKPRRARLGTSISPSGGGILGGADPSDPLFSNPTEYERSRADSEQAGGGGSVLFYRCPACKSFFSATQAGLPG